MRAELKSLLESLPTMQPERLPELLGEIEVVRATALMRLSAPGLTATEQKDELLAVDLAAERLGVSQDYVYRHAAEFPFTRRMGKRLLFSSLGIEKYIKTAKSY